LSFELDAPDAGAADGMEPLGMTAKNGTPGGFSFVGGRTAGKGCEARRHGALWGFLRGAGVGRAVAMWVWAEKWAYLGGSRVWLGVYGGRSWVTWWHGMRALNGVLNEPLNGSCWRQKKCCPKVPFSFHFRGRKKG